MTQASTSAKPASATIPATTAHAGPPLYSLIHKGIRARLFKFSITAGGLDYADSTRLNEFIQDLNLLVSSIRFHHTAEEKFIHPLISDRVPGGAVKLEEEHKLVEQQMVQMTTQLEGIRTKTSSFERSRDLALEFYLAFNRFLAFFLHHIDDEEERVQRMLFDLCTTEELTATFGRIMASQTPEELTENLKMIFSGASIDELTGLFAGAKALMPPAAFQGLTRLAESVLAPNQWTILKKRLNLA